MGVKNETWAVVSIHCPNCGKKFQAHKSAEETVSSQCPGCLAVMVRRKIGRRHIRLDIYGVRGGKSEKHCMLKKLNYGGMPTEWLR